MKNILEYLKASFFTMIESFKNDFKTAVTDRIDRPHYNPGYGNKIWDWMWAFSFFGAMIPGMITYVVSVFIWFAFQAPFIVEILQFVIISAVYSLGWMVFLAIFFRIGLAAYSVKRKADNMAKKKEQLNG